MARIDISTRPYQVQGVAKMKEMKRFGNFDDPGLGKTVQACEAAELPVLVSCPGYLVDQWAEFLNEQYPDHLISVANGPRKDREFFLSVKADWYIVNHEMFRDINGKSRRADSYDMPDVKTVIIDELHHFRGHNSSQAKNMVSYVKNTDLVYGLTATPIYTEVDDLFMQFRILQPKVWTSYWQFVDRYCETRYNGFASKVVGPKDEKLIAGILSSMGIRRTASSVGLFLPQTIERKIKIDFRPDHKKDYEHLKKDYIAPGNIPVLDVGSQLAQLRGLTSRHEKLDALKQLVSDIHEPCVIFTWYVDAAFQAAEAVKGVAITGQEPPDKRRQTVQGARGKHIVATMKSLSEGIDLSEYRVVIFYENDYTPGQVYQCLSRVRRPSIHHEPILIYYLMMKDSIDEDVHDAVETRTTTAAGILRRALAR